MNKSSNNQRLPRAKGIDMGTYYTPKECAKKVRHLVLPDMNRKIVEEFITILGMRGSFEEHQVPIPNKVVMYGPPGTGKHLRHFIWRKCWSFHLSWSDLMQLFTAIWVRLEVISGKYLSMPKHLLVFFSWMSLMPLQEHGRVMTRLKKWPVR